GKAIGRPKSATFRTADVVGLDTLAHVSKSLYDRLQDDPHRELFDPPAFMKALIEQGALGAKTRAGFYKKTRGPDGQSVILMLDPATGEYVPQPKVNIPSLGLARTMDDLQERLRALVYAKDRGGEFLWESLSATMRYAASCIPEIADNVVEVDRAMRWGFGWELGPFETWDALGFRNVCDRMVADGHALPEVAQKLYDAEADGWYASDAGKHHYFDVASGDRAPVPTRPEFIVLADKKAAGAVVLESPDATLIDLGDDVACLEFHTKMNTIGPGIIQMMHKSMDIVEKDWRGLVIGNQADHFSVGANLLLVLNEIDDDNFEDVDWMCSQFQNTNQRMRYSTRPVVAAPHGMTLGGGCEVVLGANRVAAAAETYIGLVELGAGVIPAGGGCKEFVRRIHEGVPDNPHVDLFPLVRRVFEMVGMAKVATSAREAIELGFMDHEDEVVMNRDHVIHEAKQKVLAMDIDGYRPGRPLENMRVVGEAGYAAIQAGLHNMAAGGYITEYEKFIGGKLAYVLCGGAVSSSARVSEQYILDLEREAFMSLVAEPKTQERMEHILKTGRPLRN
ncbi:MAG: 3-hydroxyacyl-CoA dehydrogenase, partial [Gemmatimonadetes bacterium]|nr:3-hydroxyacyl-CoA dehydrogenase [Gemmatimonadota bacterium]